MLIFFRHAGLTRVYAMSRLKNFSRNLATSYLQLAVNVVYSLVSIPLILHWLPPSEFGMWAVLTQLMAYISLVDLGINQAIARFLVDHKDRRFEGEYGALVKTSALVSLVQGLIVLVLVTLGSPLLASLMNIPAEYSATFINLMRIQGAIAAFTFCMNPLGIMLNAHQRMDLIARTGIYNLLAALGLLWLFLIRGNGIKSFVIAGAITAMISTCQLFWHCRRLGLLPQAGEGGTVSWRQFREVFLYGKDVFLMNLGAQLVNTSQTIIISRTLGLEVAAIWAVGTKLFVLMGRVQFQPLSAAMAGLSEMVARNEMERLRTRFQSIVVLSASLGVFLGVSFALCNSLFVTVWTRGAITWLPINDVLLGFWIFLTSLQMTHCNLVLVTKQIGAMRYLYFGEGCCFVLASLMLGYHWGLPGLLLCSIVCILIFSYQFGLRRSQRYFSVSFFDLAFTWVRSSLKLVAVMAPLGLILWVATLGLEPIWRLMIHGAAVGFGGGLLFLRIGLSPEIVWEAGARLPRPLSRLLRKLVPNGD